MRALLTAAFPTAPQAADAVARLFTERRIGKNDTLLRQGEVWQHAFLIERGLTRMHFVRRDGKEFNKNFHAEGALICPITRAMEEEPSLFSITAVEAAVVWQAPMAELKPCLTQHGVWEPMRSVLLERLITH